MELLGGIFLAVGLSVVIMFFQSRKRKQAWSGQVTKIKEILARPVNLESEYATANDSKDYTYIYYKTDGGTKGKIKLESPQYQSMYPRLCVGNRLRKISGQDYPEMVDNEG